MKKNNECISSLKEQIDILSDEIGFQKERYKNLEQVLRDYVAEAHYGCLESKTKCKHEEAICFCRYNAALSNIDDLLR